MFEDRRGQGDRRNRNGIQSESCRRQYERRAILRQYNPPQPWWLQTNYAEELQPPLLDTNPVKRQN